jgi:hypothetical protein
MKRLLTAGVIAAGLSSSAFASVGFQFGAQFYFPRIDPNGANEHWTGLGQVFGVRWGLDNGLGVGVYTETTDLNDGYGTQETFAAQAVEVSKEIVKNAAVVLRVGSFHETENDASGPLVDVLSKITLLQGAGDKVTGAIEANLGGRWADDRPSDLGNNINGGDNWSGFFATLAISASI